MGKDYLCDGIFKMNVLTIVPKLNNKIFSFAYVFEISCLWSNQLKRANFKSVRKLKNLSLLPLEFDPNYKCKIIRDY